MEDKNIINEQLLNSTQEDINSKELKEDCFKDKLNKHGQIEDEGAPEDEI